MLAEQQTQAAPVPEPAAPAAPALAQDGPPPAGPGRADPAGTASARERRLLPAGNRIVALLGIVVSGVVVIGHGDMYAQDDFLVPSVACVVLGLAAFRRLPLTSTLLWWGAGALVTAGVAAGAAVDEDDYTFVSEYDFSGTLHHYDSLLEDYCELPVAPSGDGLLEQDCAGDYVSASGESTHSCTGHETIPVLAVPALVLGVLCLAGALCPGRHSALLAASGVTPTGLGVGWLAFGTDDRIAVFSVAWGLATLAALVQELRGRTHGSPTRPATASGSSPPNRRVPRTGSGADGASASAPLCDPCFRFIPSGMTGPFFHVSKSLLSEDRHCGGRRAATEQERGTACI
ncbi:hypothetical protein ACFUN7_10080 [Streptomyces sp. NPDC057236]|uniref:hypothetical protein n=1 Tax=Streptomyces sp. NPDC057236 TaxID=3346059 RepID=UPI0036436F6F